MDEVIKQKDWTDEELRAAGFHYYEHKRQVTMARVLPASEAPLEMKFAYETLVVEAGYIICYQPGDIVYPNINDYDHWPVRPDIFADAYRAWDERGWLPTAPQRHLILHGCKPYYKYTGVWARKLSRPTYVLTLESSEPTLIPEGAWLGIGSMGGPYSMDEPTFLDRYIID